LRVRAFDPEHIHPILEHPSGDAQQGRGVSLDMARPRQGIENQLSFKFLDRFLQGDLSGQCALS